METHFRHQLEKVFNRYGFPLTTEQSEQLTIYHTELKRWNARINLTALHDDTEVIYKHFLDSVSVLEHFAIAEGQTVIDVGTGAGFPGVVLKIYIPGICLTLVEASHKKVAFLKYLISQMGLDSSIQVFAERAEICAESDEFVNAYDWVLTRYVASLEKSAKYCLPMLNTTGRWIAYKSGEIDAEINQCKESIHEFGAVVAGVYTSRITQLNRTYIVVSRVNG